MKQKLYALWRYDRFPYLLGGPVEEFGPDGKVKVSNYGHSWFMPVKILPLTVGEKLQEKLRGLEEEYRTAQKQIDNEFKTKLLSLLPPGMPEPWR